MAEVIGIAVSERLSRLLKDTNQQILNFILIAFLNFLVKFVSLNETVMMVVFFFEILLIGCTFNLWLIIMQKRVQPEFQSVSFEFNYCLASITNTFGPIVSK
jgi:hypothetical protein